MTHNGFTNKLRQKKKSDEIAVTSDVQEKRGNIFPPQSDVKANTDMGSCDDSMASDPLSNVIIKTDKVVVNLVDDDKKCSNSMLSSNENRNADKFGVSTTASKQDEQETRIPSPAWTITDW